MSSAARGHNPSSRRLALAGITLAALGLSGCGSKPIRPVNADGTWCHRIGSSLRYRKTCTTGPVPGEAVEAEAKRFEPAPGRLTVYVVRNRWADSVEIVPLQVDGRERVELLPRSFARLRLPPGDQVLRVTWATGSAEIAVGGNASDISFVELIGSHWPWGTAYRLERSEADTARKRVLAVRMVADAS